MKTYKFTPTFSVRARLAKANGHSLDNYPDELIKKETMLFSADKNFALKHGGYLTKTFLESIDFDQHDWIIDSRVHMLMPEWYPCIPGWHHDDIPRHKHNGQPNYDNPEYKSDHIMMVVGSTSHTEFINCETELPEVTNGTIYRVWDEFIEREYSHNIYKVRSGEIIDFTWQDFHRGVAADKTCWRFFIRASKNTDRKPKNEVRNQVQVYLSPLNLGW